MAKITRIKASDSKPSEEKPASSSDLITDEAQVTKIAAKPTEKDQKIKKDAEKTNQKKLAASAKSAKKSDKKVFWLFRPFVAFGRYVKASWLELRQVHWPNRKATWKMTLAVFVYCAIFLAFIILLDTIFSLLFNNLFK